MGVEQERVIWGKKDNITLSFLRNINRHICHVYIHICHVYIYMAHMYMTGKQKGGVYMRKREHGGMERKDERWFWGGK